MLIPAMPGLENKVLDKYSYRHDRRANSQCPWVRVITGSDRIVPDRTGSYRIGLKFPLVYEFYVTFLEYLRTNKQSKHVGSLVGVQYRAFFSLK